MHLSTRNPCYNIDRPADWALRLDKGNKMPLGIVSDEEFQRQTETVKSILDGVVKPIERGRGEGSTAVPTMIQKIIGETAIEEGNGAAKDIASFLGISDSSVSAYKKGATSTASYHNPGRELGRHIAKTKERIAKRAGNKLGLALSKITEDKLDAAKAVELASIAKNLSGIVKDMEDTPVGPNGNVGPSIMIFAPQIGREETYDVIEVKDPRG